MVKIRIIKIPGYEHHYDLKKQTWRGWKRIKRFVTMEECKTIVRHYQQYKTFEPIVLQEEII